MIGAGALCTRPAKGSASPLTLLPDLQLSPRCHVPQGWVDLIDVLITELGNQVDARDNYQFTPLHSAANGGHVTTIQRLVSAGSVRKHRPGAAC